MGERGVKERVRKAPARHEPRNVRLQDLPPLLQWKVGPPVFGPTAARSLHDGERWAFRQLRRFRIFDELNGDVFPGGDDYVGA